MRKEDKKREEWGNEKEPFGAGGVTAWSCSLPEGENGHLLFFLSD